MHVIWDVMTFTWRHCTVFPCITLTTLLVLVGKISIAISADWLEPRDRSNPSDQAASEIGMATRIGWYAQPVFGDGDYPQHVKDMAAKMVKRAGLPHNPLPQFTAEEIALNKGKCFITMMSHERHGGSNHRQVNYLFNSFRLKTKQEKQKVRITGP